MKFYYKDFEYPSFLIKTNGYFLPANDDTPAGEDTPFISNEVSEYVIMPENNKYYFDEWFILYKINSNEDNLFDFNKAILDIGAHSGVYSFKSNFKYAYSFEPNKKMFPFLNINLMLHDKYFESKTFNVLLSDKNEMITFDGFSAALNDSELQSEYFNSNNAEKIYSHTLDEYNLNNIGYIKIDVEGMEEKVLRGGLGTIIRNNYPPILFECWGIIDDFSKNRHDLLEKLLIELGYDILWGWGNFQTHLAIHK